MLENQRKERIIGLLTENTTMSTSELSKRLYVSDATVRRDLGDLERAGRIHRVHGGAELVSGPGIQIPLTARDRENDTAKRNIAAKAISSYTPETRSFSTRRRPVCALCRFSACGRG